MFWVHTLSCEQITRQGRNGRPKKTKQALQTDSDMTQILELPEREFKMETVKKKKKASKEILEMKNTVRETGNILYSLLLTNHG